MAPLAGNGVQEISLLRTVLVPVLTPAWKCLLVSRDAFQQCPPAPYLRSSALAKIGCFLPRQKYQMRKRESRTSRSHYVSASTPQKRSQDSKVAPWALHALPPTLPSVVQGNIWLCNNMMCLRWVWIFFM